MASVLPPRFKKLFEEKGAPLNDDDNVLQGILNFMTSRRSDTTTNTYLPMMTCSVVSPSLCRKTWCYKTIVLFFCALLIAFSLCIGHFGFNVYQLPVVGSATLRNRHSMNNVSGYTRFNDMLLMEHAFEPDVELEVLKAIVIIFFIIVRLCLCLIQHRKSEQAYNGTIHIDEEDGEIFTYIFESCQLFTNPQQIEVPGLAKLQLGCMQDMTLTEKATIDDSQYSDTEPEESTDHECSDTESKKSPAPQLYNNDSVDLPPPQHSDSESACFPRLKAARNRAKFAKSRGKNKTTMTSHIRKSKNLHNTGIAARNNNLKQTQNLSNHHYPASPPPGRNIRKKRKKLHHDFIPVHTHTSTDEDLVSPCRGGGPLPRGSGQNDDHTTSESDEDEESDKEVRQKPDSGYQGSAHLSSTAKEEQTKFTFENTELVSIKKADIHKSKWQLPDSLQDPHVLSGHDSQASLSELTISIPFPGPHKTPNDGENAQELALCLMAFPYSQSVLGSHKEGLFDAAKEKTYIYDPPCPSEVSDAKVFVWEVG